MLNRAIALFSAAVCLSTLSFSHESGEHSRHDTDETMKLGELQSSKPWSLGLELRPSWHTDSAEYFSENSIEGAYRLTTGFALGYTQEFNTNLYSRAEESTTGGLNLAAHEGYLIGKMEPLLENKNKGVSISYEPRLILPTDAECRNAGMLTSLRNDFAVNKSLSDKINISASLIPIIHLYSQAGSVGLQHDTEHPEEEEPALRQANPLFENRLYLASTISFSDSLKLSVPVKFHVTKYRDFDDSAKLNNQFGYYLCASPELTWAMSADYSIGLSYYTGNLVQDDLSGFTLAEGLRTSVAQFIFRTEI